MAAKWGESLGLTVEWKQFFSSDQVYQQRQLSTLMTARLSKAIDVSLFFPPKLAGKRLECSQKQAGKGLF